MAEQCGCTLVLGKAGIRYCRLHSAAAVMLATLEEMSNMSEPNAIAASVAIAQARGQK